MISCVSATKTFNLAGLQASTTIFPNLEMKKKFDRFWMNMDIHRNNAFSSVAMEAAYNEGEEWLDQLRDYLDENIRFVKEFVKEQLPKASVTAVEGTYLIWLDLNGYESDPKKLEKLMQETARIAFDEGYIFGEEGNGFERINAAMPKRNVEDCMNRLKKALDTLN